MQLAALDLLGDLLHRFLEGPASRDGLKRAHCRGDHRSATARLATLYPLERLPLGDLDRRPALGRRRGDRVVEPVHGVLDAGALDVRAAPGPLAGDVDQPAAVGQEVGHVEDVAARQGGGDAAVGERVVGRARDDAHVERARQGVVDQPAGGAGREHVQLGVQDGLGGRRDRDPVLGGESLAARRGRCRSRARSAPAEASPAASAPPTLPSPITPTRRPSSSSEPVWAATPRRSAASTVSAVTGEGSPRPPLPTERPTQKRVKRDMWSMSAVVVPMSSAVMYAPPSPVDHRGGALEPREARGGVAVVDHHGLAAAEIESRGGGLQGHRAREAHDVLERLAQAARVALEAQAAEGGAEHGRVDGDDEAQARVAGPAG